MDNPLAGSSDSEDSDGSGGMFDFTDSEDASSDDGGEPEPVVDDDFMANLMPTSRLDGDGGDDDDDSSSEDEGPMTAEQIRALRAGAAPPSRKASASRALALAGASPSRTW